MKQKEFIEKIGELLFVEGIDLTMETELDDLEGWDSLGRLGIIALVNDSFNEKIDAKKLKLCRKISNIVELVKDKLED